MQTNLSSKLIAEYAELANKYLDQIPVETTEDFETIASALKCITESNEPPQKISDSLKGRITEIKEIIDNPDMYVERGEHYEQFQNIILNRVSEKIKELSQLTPEQKEHYLAVHTKIKEEKQEKHKVMNEHTPPDLTSEAHTISQQAMLAEQQAQFQAGGQVITSAQGIQAYLNISDFSPEALVEIAFIAEFL